VAEVISELLNRLVAAADGNFLGQTHTDNSIIGNCNQLSSEGLVAANGEIAWRLA
jgi:hypothetical protein